MPWGDGRDKFSPKVNLYLQRREEEKRMYLGIGAWKFRICFHYCTGEDGYVDDVDFFGVDGIFGEINRCRSLHSWDYMTWCCRSVPLDLQCGS